MPATRSGLRCATGSVSGSASTATSSSAPASTTSAANTQCHEACSSTAAPSDGATHRRDAEHQHQPRQHRRRRVVLEQVADHRDRHHHRRGRAHALQHPRDAQHRDVRGEQAQQRRHHVQHDAGHQRPAAAQRVRQRTDDQLSQRQPGQRAGQRQLRHRRRHRQVVGDLRQRRQVHVDRQRAQRDEQPQHHDHPDTAGWAADAVSSGVTSTAGDTAMQLVSVASRLISSPSARTVTAVTPSAPALAAVRCLGVSRT